jgi:phosphonate transport system ATP-binding protein
MLNVADLTVRYGDFTALKEINLFFEAGKITVLLGRSGAGKSTLLRCLNQLQQQTSGRLQVDGFGELTTQRSLRAYRRATGNIFQMHQLIMRQSALDNVLAGRLGYYSTLRSLFPFPGKDVQLAMDCLERVGLADKALRRAEHLSGGERQRVGIARALCQEPKLLLADEPVASLDPATAQEVITLLERIVRKDGLTLIVSLHQLEFARRIADRIVGMARGQVVFDGPPSDLDEAVVRRLYRRGDEEVEESEDASVGAEPVPAAAHPAGHASASKPKHRVVLASQPPERSTTHERV